MPKILVIENESGLLDSLILSLRVEGYDVTGTEDNHNGINLAYQLTPNAIIWDFRELQISESAVFGGLRQTQATENIPFILISAHQLSDNVILQFDSYLRKPFNRHDLMAAVRRAIAH